MRTPSPGPEHEEDEVSKTMRKADGATYRELVSGLGKLRRPRKTDVAALARLAAGERLWDRRAVERRARRRAMESPLARDRGLLPISKEDRVALLLTAPGWGLSRHRDRLVLAPGASDHPERAVAELTLAVAGLPGPTDERRTGIPVCETRSTPGDVKVAFTTAVRKANRDLHRAESPYRLLSR